jgi:hypothetical protein
MFHQGELKDVVYAVHFSESTVPTVDLRFPFVESSL